MAMPLARRGTCGSSRSSQPSGSSPAMSRFELRGQVGVALRVRAAALLPFGLGRPAPRQRPPGTAPRPAGDQRSQAPRPAEVLLGERALLRAQRRAVGFEGVLLVGAAVAEVVRTMISEGRPVSARAAAGPASIGFEVVAVLHRDACASRRPRSARPRPR